MAAQQAVEHAIGAEKAHVLMCAQQGVGELDMVRMIMSQQNPLYAIHTDSARFQRLLDEICFYTGVYKNAAMLGADIATVSTRARAERNVIDYPGGRIVVDYLRLCRPLRGGSAVPWSRGAEFLKGDFHLSGKFYKRSLGSHF